MRSHQRAVAAHEAGRFADELVPVTVPGDAASPTSSSTATSTPAPTPPSRSWRRCARCMGQDRPEATVTAGNASGQNDGAAMCVVTTRDDADRLGLRPLRAAAVVGRRRRARPRSWASARCPPPPRPSSGPGSPSTTST